MILWSVNDKFSLLYEKKTSSSIKTVSSYNPSQDKQSPSNPEYEKFLSLYKIEKQNPLQPQTPSPQERYNMMQPQSFIPSIPPQGFSPQTPPVKEFSPQTPPTPPTPPEGFSPPTPPTPPEGFSPQTPELTDILTELKEIKTELEEIKEDKTETTGGSTVVDDILGVSKENIKEEDTEYIKGGNTKKIMLR
jgi:hypothetical protein